MATFSVQNFRDLLVIRSKTIIHQDLSIGSSSLVLTREVKVVTESSAHSEAGIRESVKEFHSYSLGEETGLLNISSS